MKEWAEGKGQGVHGHREGKIEGVARRYVCEQYPSVCIRVRRTGRIGIRIGSTNGRKLVTAGLSDLRAERPAALTPLGRSIALSTPLAVASRHRAPCLPRQLANLPTRVPFRNY